MNSVSYDLFRLAESKLSWLESRQNVLSQNVANANTPRFEAKDVQPFAAVLDHAIGAPLPMQTSSPLHLAGNTPVISASTTKSQKSPDGNTVSVEDQLTKIADVSMNQQLIGNIYRKYTGLFRLALGRS